MPFRKRVQICPRAFKAIATGEVTGKPITERRQLKLLNSFVLFFKAYPKETNKITREELSNIKEKLLNDKILRQDGKPYSDSTKENMTETIVRYLEWKYPKKMNSFISKQIGH